VFAFGHRDALGGQSHGSRLPERVRSLKLGAVQRVFAGGNGSFAVVADDDIELPEVLHAWGYNQKFQLGRCNVEVQLVVPGPTSMPRLAGMQLKCLGAGMYHCLALHAAPTIPVLPPSLGERCFGSAALWQMLDGDVEYDVSIKAADGDCLGAHRCVLAVRSPILATWLKRPNDNSPRPWCLDLSGHRCSTICALLEYLYCDFCRAAPDVAAGLKPLAEELCLTRLASGVSAAAQTASVDSDVCWVRTAAGKWTQVAADTAPRVVIESTYTQDLLSLVRVAEADVANCDDDFVGLRINQYGSTNMRCLHVARPLLLASSFFRALVEGGFAESQNLRSGAGHVEISTDNADAMVLCLQLLATGEAEALMPSEKDEVIALLVEAHKLSLAAALNAAELKLSKLVSDGGIEDDEMETIIHLAKLYDLERLAREAALLQEERHLCKVTKP
jgi:hypothetical protein